MFTTVVAVTGSVYKNKDGTSRQELLGTLYDDYYMEGYEDEIVLKLKPDTKNKHDENAVAVWCMEPEEAKGMLGYIPSEHAPDIKAALKRKKVRKVEFDHMGVRRGNKIWARLVIQIRGKKEAEYGDLDLFEDEDGETFRMIG